MTTIIVKNSRFISHSKVNIPKGTVKAELVDLQLDKSWDGMSVFIHWHNLGTNVEKRLLLKDPPQQNEIPWEVLNDLGELRMGLVGMDGEITVKPTIWLTFGRVVEGPDVDGGEDTRPPTPGWAQQMVEQATAAAEASKAAQEAAEQAGPYAQAAQDSADAAKASEVSAASSAQQAQAAAQQAVSSIGNAVDLAQSAATAAGSAQRAAETAQAGAAQSAGTAQTAATTASQAAQTAQGAATQAGKYLSNVEADAQAAANAATAAGKSQEAAQSYDQEAKEAAEAAKASQDAAATSAQQANEAAQTAQKAAGSIGDAVQRAEDAATEAGTAQQAAETARDAAARSAETAQGAATMANQAKVEAEAAAAILPPLSENVAGKFLAANSLGNGMEFVDGPSGGSRTLPPIGSPQLSFVVPGNDSAVYYFDEINGKKISDFGYTFARVEVQNSPQESVGTGDIFASVNATSPTMIESEIASNGNFLFQTKQMTFSGWIDTSFGVAAAPVPSTSPTFRSQVYALIRLKSQGNTIKSIGFRTWGEYIPAGTKIEVWFA